MYNKLLDGTHMKNDKLNAYESERNREHEKQESQNSGVGLLLMIVGIIGLVAIVGSESFTAGTGVLLLGLIVLVIMFSLP